MSGHSKWSTIKRKKGVTDAKRGAVFTKLGNLIAIAAREKGGDMDTNFGLRMAVDKAKSANMPKDNIERAIKRGTGELEGQQIEELIYEGIGPVNSQFVIKAVTDNKNRSAAVIRHALTKFGGSLGSVMWNFEQKGVVRIEAEIVKEDKLDSEDAELELIDLGAEDVINNDDGMEIILPLTDLQKASKFFEDKGTKIDSAELEYIAKDKVEVTDDEKESIEKFIDLLDECEDVGDWYTNIIL
jgi:YebC/PmpR family DNA-binding regulatory protein